MKQEYKLKWVLTGVLLYATVCLYAGNIPDHTNALKASPAGVFPCQFLEPLLSRPISYSNRGDLMSIGHFYQQLLGSEGQAGWNVTSVGTFFYFDCLSMGITLDQGDYLDQGDHVWSTDISHRVGIQLGQSYTNNDSLYFRVMFATDTCFAGSAFNMGYSWQSGMSTRLGIDVHGLGFEQDELYFSVAAIFIKSFNKHLLTVKPYYSASQRGKINLLISDKIFIGERDNYLLSRITTGYFPDTYAFVDYGHITDTRYHFSCEGWFSVSNERMCLVPALGFEQVKGDTPYTSWYIQLGIQFYI